MVQWYRNKPRVNGFKIKQASRCDLPFCSKKKKIVLDSNVIKNIWFSFVEFTENKYFRAYLQINNISVTPGKWISGMQIFIYLFILFNYLWIECKKENSITISFLILSLVYRINIWPSRSPFNYHTPQLFNDRCGDDGYPTNMKLR